MYVVKAVACLRLFLCFVVLDPIYDLPSIIELTSVSFSFCLCLFLSVCLSPSLYFSFSPISTILLKVTMMLMMFN